MIKRMNHTTWWGSGASSCSTVRVERGTDVLSSFCSLLPARIMTHFSQIVNWKATSLHSVQLCSHFRVITVTDQTCELRLSTCFSTLQKLIAARHGPTFCQAPFRSYPDVPSLPWRASVTNVPSLSFRTSTRHVKTHSLVHQVHITSIMFRHKSTWACWVKDLWLLVNFRHKTLLDLVQGITGDVLNRT